MGLLDGDGAALLSGVFAPLYRDANLQKVEQIEDGLGGFTERSIDYDIKVQRDEFSSHYRTQANIPSSHAKFIVLLPGADAEPAQNDLLELDELSWRVVEIVSRDPTGASMVIRCSPHG